MDNFIIVPDLDQSNTLRGLVQSPCGKINVIMTLTSSPPPPLNVTALDTGVTYKIQILTHSVNAGGISRLVQPQECITTTKICL